MPEIPSTDEGLSIPQMTQTQHVDDSEKTKTSNASDDLVQTRSRVNPPKRLDDQQRLWLVLASLVLILFMLSRCSSHHEAVKAKALASSSQTSEAELKANMSALKQNPVDTPVSTDQAMMPRAGGVPNQANNTQQPVISDEAQAMLIQQRQQALLAERQALQARLAAPSSFMESGGGGRSTQQQSSSQTGGATGGPSQAVLAGSGANNDFANQQTGVDTASASTISHPDDTVAQGELIQATLETPIDSDLPGMVRAVTTVPVYAYTGNTPLIPAGSRLIGQYSAGVVQGQSRIMVVWNRVILPGGITAQLNSPGTDDQGMAGQGADSVNRHFWTQFGQATLLSIIGAGTANVGVNSNDEYNSASAYRSALSNSFSNTANDVYDQNSNIKPTLKVFQGAQINVFVARDVDFYSVLAQD